MTKEQVEIMRYILYAVETGGQVYGNQRYDAFIEAGKNTPNETAITIGAGQWYGEEAQRLLRLIRLTDETMFLSLDKAGIGDDVDTENWSTYQISASSDKAKCIQKIISSNIGIECQDKLMGEQVVEYEKSIAALDVTDIKAMMMCINIRHLGGLNAVKRILNKTQKPYTIDGIYNALKTDQYDDSSNNQVGDSLYWSRHVKVYGWINEKIKEEPLKKEESKMVTEKTITICGHGSGNPSTKNMYTYLSQRYSCVASNGVRGGVVCVLRLKALTDDGRKKFVDKYSTILGRNIYSQSLRSYVYKTYNGKYYSDCSSSICATFAAIGYNVPLFNTAGMYYSSLFEKVPVKIVNGHITNPDILKVGDCLMFAGSDPSRPLQIGHVEAIYKIGDDSSTTTQDFKSLYVGTGKKGMLLCADLNYRTKPVNGTVKGTFEKGKYVFPTERTVGGAFPSYWFKVNGYWCSGKYLKGWVLDKTANKWWWNDQDSYPKSEWLLIDGKWYYFKSDGYMASDAFVKSTNKELWYYVDTNGVWVTSKDVTVKPTNVVK